MAPIVPPARLEEILNEYRKQIFEIARVATRQGERLEVIVRLLASCL
jgi:hypothetical protein